MADFCKQCSEEDFGEDSGDLKGLCPEGMVAVAICEGCGGTVVDHTGKCVSPTCLAEHGQITRQLVLKLTMKD